MIGTPANVIAPGKRMLSSQTPTLVFRDGRLVLVTGSPGGRTIINTVLCTVVNVVDFRRSRGRRSMPRGCTTVVPRPRRFRGPGSPEYAAALEQLRRWATPSRTSRASRQRALDRPRSADGPAVRSPTAASTATRQGCSNVRGGVLIESQVTPFAFRTARASCGTVL